MTEKSGLFINRMEPLFFLKIIFEVIVKIRVVGPLWLLFSNGHELNDLVTLQNIYLKSNLLKEGLND